VSIVSDAPLAGLFVFAAAISLTTSWLLVSRLERIGARIGLSEALLGMLAALAADAPEITASVTALAGHHARIGAGVVIGSNVFNLAALLGVSAIVAGEIRLHRRVILLEGTVALLIATVCLGVVLGGPGPGVGLLVSACVLVPYLVVSGVSPRKLRSLRLPAAWVRWLAEAVVEEGEELEPAIHPSRAGALDVTVALLATAIVVVASVAMELTASTLGTRHHVPGIVTGALVLAGVTSLPNAVSALYLAVRGRGAATLSIALNSNAINVTVGLLLPGVVVGLGAPSGQGTLVAGSYLGLTALTLVCAYAARGLRRAHGALIIAGYLAFVAAVLIVS
jgi:cation:H+ antiporter